ncbi:MAG: DUF2177 family protein [Cytophagales bacterium]|jgi:uncharacterized membrane protein|nr:DUF2177 family protein [Cytophagales bacterium]MCA6388468.1 DUF2177 family protein [Cytophagales bacterium]MCA6390893.1 DUF2177 family protein [Cytophagales bacterium]MCA6394882.1 DUF2177 family protein [Cytophagales bacterium]MCA6399081.1 DUF2177 family protein [Cytophagales bacterium]
MRLFLKLYLIALPIFFMVDMIWLGLLAKNFYKNQIGFLMKPDVNWTAAIIFYLLFLVGVVLFVIEPALEKKNLMFALSRGALFGLITYATYDLTNLATLKDWPLKVVVVDMIWGAVLSGTVCGSSYWIANKLGL